VDVVVTDEKGQPIPALKAEDFVVKENGVAQSILEFEAVDVSEVLSAPDPSAPATHEVFPVATNESGDEPGRVFLVVLDDLNLSPASAEAVRPALTSFFDIQLRDGDRVTVAPTSGGAWWSGRMTLDRDDLLAALKALKGRRIPETRPERMSDHEAMLIDANRDTDAIAHVAQRYALYGLVGPVPTRYGQLGLPAVTGAGEGLARGIAADVYRQARARTEATLLNLERAMAALAAGRGRRSVLLVSDGFIQDNKLAEFQRVREVALRSNAVLYFLDARGVRTSEMGGPDLPMPADPSYKSLELEYAAAANAGADALAMDTGGFTISNTNDLGGALGRLTRQSRTFYLLGYEPADKRQDGRFRKIQVEVRRPGAVIHARKGYYASGGKQETAAAEKPGSPDPAMARAVDSIVEERGIPLRMAAYVLGAAAEGRATVVLTAEADPAALGFESADGLFKGTLDTRSSVAARDTSLVGNRDRRLDLALRPEARAQMATSWVPVTHAYELVPGRYQASLAVRDRRSGRLGSVRQTFDVPDLHSLRLTTPVLTDTVQRGATAEAPPIPIPIARRTFASGVRLVCTFSVEGASRTDQAAPRVAITYEVRRRDGTVVTRTEPTALQPDEHGVFTSRFALTLNRPGSYEIHLKARDEATGQTAAAVEPFLVAAPPPQEAVRPGF
jgi:VWFA-related protein